MSVVLEGEAKVTARARACALLTDLATRTPSQHALPPARQVVNASSETKTLKAGTYTGTVEL